VNDNPRFPGKQKRKPLYVAPSFYSVGNCAEEIFWAINYAALTRNSLEIIAPFKWTQILGYKICNSELFRINLSTKNKYTFIRRNVSVQVAFNLLFVFRRILSKILTNIFRWPRQEQLDFLQTGKSNYWPMPNTEPFEKYCFNLKITKSIHQIQSITVRKNTRKACAEKIKALNLDPNKNWVCLHVREGGFHGDHQKRPYRNASIKNYQEAIHFLTKKFTVFRLGDSTMAKAPFQQKGFIDYAHSKLKSEEMDLFLVENCSFFVGMQSGLLDVAFLFQKPVLIVNGYEWFYSNPLKKIDRLLLRPASLGKDPSLLGFEDRLRLPFYFTDVRAQISPNEMNFRENSPDQILQAVRKFTWEHARSFRNTVDRDMKKRRRAFLRRSREINNGVIQKMLNQSDCFHAQNAARYLIRNLACQGQFYEF